MKKIILALAAILTLTPAYAAPLRITFDPGGGVLDRYKEWVKQRESGDRVIIDGLCISACTFVTGLVPNQQVCVTPYARLGFHSAWTQGEDGEEKFAREATRLEWSIFPEAVREMMRKHGWSSGDVPHPGLIFIEGAELRTLYRDCTPEDLAAN